jgi:hypothetical protein
MQIFPCLRRSGYSDWLHPSPPASLGAQRRARIEVSSTAVRTLPWKLAGNQNVTVGQDPDSSGRPNTFQPFLPLVPPPDPRRAAPDADRMELAGTANTAVGSRPRSDPQGRADPRQTAPIGARSAERGSKEVRRHRGRCRRSRAEHNRRSGPSCPPRPPPESQARSAERGSKRARRQCGQLPSVRDEDQETLEPRSRQTIRSGARSAERGSK